MSASAAAATPSLKASNASKASTHSGSSFHLVCGRLARAVGRARGLWTCRAPADAEVLPARPPPATHCERSPPRLIRVQSRFPEPPLLPKVLPRVTRRELARVASRAAPSLKRRSEKRFVKLELRLARCARRCVGFFRSDSPAGSARTPGGSRSRSRSPGSSRAVRLAKRMSSPILLVRGAARAACGASGSRSSS